MVAIFRNLWILKRKGIETDMFIIPPPIIPTPVILEKKLRKKYLEKKNKFKNKSNNIEYNIHYTIIQSENLLQYHRNLIYSSIFHFLIFLIFPQLTEGITRRGNNRRGNNRRRNNRRRNNRRRNNGRAPCHWAATTMSCRFPFFMLLTAIACFMHFQTEIITNLPWKGGDRGEFCIFLLNFKKF